MIADYNTGKLDIKSNQFKLITAVACVAGLTVPLIGGNPIEIQILTQVLLVFILPLVILGITILINRKSLVGDYSAGWLLNVGLITALIFSIIISYNGILVLIK